MADNRNDSPRGSEAPDQDLRRYLRMVVDRVWLLVAALVVGGVAFAFWASKQIRIYQATATVIVDVSPPQVFGSDVREVVQMGPEHFYAMQDYIQTQRRVLTSDKLARRVIESLALLEDNPDNRVVWSGAPPGDLVAATQALAGMVGAEHILDTHIIAVTVTHHDPRQAKRLVDAVVDSYISENQEQHDEPTKGASDLLSAEATTIREKLQLAEMALYNFKKDNDLLSVALEDRINGVTRRIDKLTDALTDVRLKRASRVAEADELERLATSDPSVLPTLSAVAASESAIMLKKDLADEERKLSELRARYEDPHPLVKQQAAKVAAVATAMRREVVQQLRAAQARGNEVGAEEGKIYAQLEEAKRDGLRVNRLEIEYNKLKRESDALAKQYTMVQNRAKETELAAKVHSSEKVRSNNLHVLDYARVPTTAVSPRLLRSGFLAGVMSLAIGFLLVLIFDALDRSLKAQGDVEARLGLPFLGVMPHVGGAADLHVADEPQSPAAESCRLIRTSLLFAGMSRPLNRILITSAQPRDGKTIASISLAVVMAQAGNKVLLIDGDLRRPRLATVFGLGPADGDRAGLTSVLLGTVPLEAAVQATRVPNLFILPAGPIPPNPAELIHSGGFVQLLDECGRRYERVIIDSPPAVAIADPAILSSYCDGVVLVVRSHKTSHDHAARAQRNLTDAGARILGVVLNDVTPQSAGYGRYGYGYRLSSREHAGDKAGGKGGGGDKSDSRLRG